METSNNEGIPTYTQISHNYTFNTHAIVTMIFLIEVTTTDVQVESSKKNISFLVTLFWYLIILQVRAGLCPTVETRDVYGTSSSTHFTYTLLHFSYSTTLAKTARSLVGAVHQSGGRA